ncbi:WH2 domain-containing protein [Candidatus Cardinium hertigii]|uniref:WH2 domain-containing protein n=1 Tax=Candidatus Cardinium hertigii TaxID=247481 RepID=UPI003D7E2D98
MASKHNKYKFITQGLVGPNILFPAVYLLFSAEICTSSPKDKPRNGIGNRYVATPQVNQMNKIEEINDSEGEANDFSQLHEVEDDLAIDSAHDDESFDADTDTTIGLLKPLEQLGKGETKSSSVTTTDTDITTPSVEPSEDSVAKDESKASVVDTTSKEEQKKEGSTRGVDNLRPSPDVLVKDACSEIPIDSKVPPKRPECRGSKSKSRSITSLNQSSDHIPNLLQTLSDTNKLVISPPLNSEVKPQPPKLRRDKSTLPVIVEKDSSNSRLSSNQSSDGNTFVPPPPPLLPKEDNSRPSSKSSLPSSSPEIDKNNRTVDKNESDGSPNQVPPADLLKQIREGIELKKLSKEEFAKKPQDNRSEMLKQIRSGFELRKVEKKPEQKPLNTTEHNDVASILARRVVVEVSDSESGSESESESGSSWGDDDSNDSLSPK